MHNYVSVALHIYYDDADIKTVAAQMLDDNVDQCLLVYKLSRRVLKM